MYEFSSNDTVANAVSATSGAATQLMANGMSEASEAHALHTSGRVLETERAR